MRDVEDHDTAIRRALRRDDLLTLAAAADRAIGIVRQRDQAARLGVEGQTLFDLALSRHVTLARTDHRWAIQAQAWDHAAAIVGYCDLVGIPIVSTFTARQMHDNALRALEENERPPGKRPLDKDLTLGVFVRYHAVRNHRLEDRLAEALELAERSPTNLFGTGAEPHTAHFLYEIGAIHIAQGRPRQARNDFEERTQYWSKTRAQEFSTRYRFEFIRALVSWSATPNDPRVGQRLDASLGLLFSERTGAAENVSTQDGADGAGVRELSVLLTAAEYLVASADPNDEHAPATAEELGSRALAAANAVRARWRVVARTRAPLAEVFQRVFADLALLAYRIGDEPAAELGLHAALSAKATGFAVRIRDGLTFDDNPLINGLLEQISEIENPTLGPMTDSPERRRQQLDALHDELAEAVSPMLADTVFPQPTDLTDLFSRIGPRYALDFVELEDSLDQTTVFRTLVQPGGPTRFDLVDSDESFDFYTHRTSTPGRAPADADGQVERSAAREVVPEFVPDAPAIGPDFRTLARRLLPPRLNDLVSSTDGREAPIQLLISGHSWLSRLPWAALQIDDRGTCLVERAVITQCPVLTSLTGGLPPAVTGTALIRLVGRTGETEQENSRSHDGVDVAAERAAWGLPRGTDSVLLSRVELDRDSVPARYDGRFDAALEERGRWQFLHIASHGSGQGLNQRLEIPGESLSAARALGLRWPDSVLMASCHVGLVLNENDQEPLSFVTSILTGGARCAVAGIDRVDDAATGRVAHAIVRAVREEHLSLSVALRQAQLAEIEAGTPESGWARLSAYVR